MIDTSFRSGGASGEFSIGSALSRTFDVFKAGAGRFLALAAVPAVPALLVGLTTDPIEGASRSMGAAFFLQLFLGFVVQGASVYGAFQEMRGQSFTLGESIGKGLERILPLLGAALLTTLGVLLGLMLLLIPGLFLLVIWSVSAPACVVERLGPVASMSRSAALTKGHRWK
ncbi:MAG: hypothetical protein ACREDP_25405, partial [Bradyrhizobium sp.]